MKNLHLLLTIIPLLLTIIYSCEENELSQTKPNSSFDLIQQKVLNVSCAIGGCHASQSDLSFLEHTLILKEGVAYENLVNVDPSNVNAHEDGLKIVDPGNTEGSLLLHKLHCHQDHHEKDYGNPMPLGMASLSSGQIDFITQWIEEGASKDAIIQADTNLLNDNIPSCQEDFTALPLPDMGRGYQIKIDAFDVPSHFEREIFLYKDVGNQEPEFINRIQMKMRRNSHHFLVNTFSDKTPPSLLPQVDVLRDLRDFNNNLIAPTVAQMEYQIFTVASQVPEMEYHFPPGVALKIPSHHKLDVNLHYVNKTTNTLKGECYLNLYTTDPDEVLYEAQPIFFSNENIFLPANEKTIILKTFTTSVPMKIFMLTSHTHKLAERFEIQVIGGVRNGEIVYSNSNWHHPQVKTYDTPLELGGGEGLKMIVTYNNTTNKAVSFGLTSENEMAIIYGYYY